jgi:predicted transcriptional regulator
MNMKNKILFTSGGIPVTEEMIDNWAEAAERGELPGEPGPVRRGRPFSVGSSESAEVVSFRLDSARKAKLERLAKERETDRSEVIRQLIDAA